MILVFLNQIFKLVIECCNFILVLQKLLLEISVATLCTMGNLFVHFSYLLKVAVGASHFHQGTIVLKMFLEPSVSKFAGLA